MAVEIQDVFWSEKKKATDKIVCYNRLPFFENVEEVRYILFLFFILELELWKDGHIHTYACDAHT